MESKLVITLGRQFGSGGHEIGKHLAELLNIKFYDKELITEAAKESGLSSEYFTNADERLPNGLMYALSVGFMYNGALSGESIFKFQSDVIRDVIHKEPCLIVGRCADYILREHPRLVTIFIHAPIEERIKRICERNHIDSKRALELISKNDKSRAAYYNFYTDKSWGKSASYDISINSALMDTHKSAEFLKQFIESL